MIVIGERPKPKEQEHRVVSRSAMMFTAWQYRG